MQKIERVPVPMVLNPPPNIIRVTNSVQVPELIEFLKANKEFGFDVETTPVKDFYWRRMRTMQLGNSSKQYVIDLKAFCGGNSDLLYKCQGEYGKNLHLAPQLLWLIQQLEPYLCSSDTTKVGVNLGFEYICMYWMFGQRIYGLYDCMLAEKCIWAGMPGKATLKNYDYYSMEEMCLRYFNMQIDKALQTSFNLDDELSDEQWEYAALDTRTPLGLKVYQSFIASGETPQSLRKKGLVGVADSLSYMPEILFGDNLHEIISIENGAIGSFIDMHLHGENIDTERWSKRVDKSVAAFGELLMNLDKIFLPIVGSKNEAIDDATIDKMEAEWKSYNIEPIEEKKIKLNISALKKWVKKNPEKVDGVIETLSQIEKLESERLALETARKAAKEVIKKECSTLKKKRTKIKNLAKDCEGEALINYGSDAQLLACLKANFPKLESLEGLDDDILEKYEKIPVMKYIREYHGLSKDIGTYGYAWVKKWTTHPCKEEGWLHPGDGKLHCEFNQYDAETGRSSSSKPNGQNLPQDKEVRSSFIADSPDESIRISDCCEADTFVDSKLGEYGARCEKCGNPCSTHAEEYVIITADMSGAELRIIAEDSGDEQWIAAFKRGDDLHSVGTELLYPDIWPGMTVHSKLKPEGWTLQDCKEEVVMVIKDEDGKDKKIGPCAYFALKPDGTLAHKKCNCPGHVGYRNDTKACNFLLAYGGGPRTLAENIKKSLKVAKQLMALHEQKNKPIWIYLDESGKKASMSHKSFDLFGRRRVLPEPTWDDARDNCKEYNEKQLRLDAFECEKNLNTFIQIKARKPDNDELWSITHREPTAKEVANSFYQLTNGRSRQGKNMRIQGTNASIIKVAMGSGYAPDKTPFLWHTLPKLKAKLIKMVHDELVLQAPKRLAEKVAASIGVAFSKAAAIKMSKVEMTFDYNIKSHWSK